MEVLKLKNSIPEMKNSLDRINSRMMINEKKQVNLKRD